MTDSSKKTLVLNSSADQMERVEPFVEELKNWAGFGDEDYNRIFLALSEAVDNAITHGNAEDPDKKAFINARLQEDTLRISVKDEGPGFDPEELPNPLKKENLLNEGGRGIYLIKQYADEVQFSEAGSKITIIFYLER